MDSELITKVRNQTDKWWLDHIEEQGLLRPEIGDDYILQTPPGMVLRSDGSVVTESEFMRIISARGPIK